MLRAYVSRLEAQRLKNGVHCDASSLLSGSANTGHVLGSFSTARQVEELSAPSGNCPEVAVSYLNAREMQ